MSYHLVITVGEWGVGNDNSQSVATIGSKKGGCKAKIHLETLRGWYDASDGDDADVLDADADYDDGGDDADDLPQSPPLPQHCVRV